MTSLPVRSGSDPRLGEDLVSELMQEDCTLARIAQDLSKQFANRASHSLMSRFLEIHKVLRQDASRSAAVVRRSTN